MITFSGTLKRWLQEGFESEERAAEFLGISRNHYRSVLNGESGVGPELITLMKEKLGWPFERAFEITAEDSDAK